MDPSNKGDDYMPNDNENIHVETTPHLDGEKESIINDSTASAGSQMGIQMDTKEVAQERNPFHFTLKQDPEMKQLGKLMGVNKKR
jgi:hypothetical protein